MSLLSDAPHSGVNYPTLKDNAPPPPPQILVQSQPQPEPVAQVVVEPMPSYPTLTAKKQTIPVSTWIIQSMLVIVSLLALTFVTVAVILDDVVELNVKDGGNGILGSKLKLGFFDVKNKSSQWLTLEQLKGETIKLSPFHTGMGIVLMYLITYVMIAVSSIGLILKGAGLIHQLMNKLEKPSKLFTIGCQVTSVLALSHLMEVIGLCIWFYCTSGASVNHWNVSGILMFCAAVCDLIYEVFCCFL